MKLKMTRPQFLTKFFTGELEDLTLEDIQAILPGLYKEIYCCYSLMKKYDFDKSVIIAANIDQETHSIGIEMESAKYPKLLKDECNRAAMTIGATEYLIKVKAKKNFAFIEFLLLSDSDDDDDE